jgi:hypothetical protein
MGGRVGVALEPAPDFACAVPGCIELAGVRPYRKVTFRLEPETIGSRFVVHNYGHGGGDKSDRRHAAARRRIPDPCLCSGSAVDHLGCGRRTVLPVLRRMPANTKRKTGIRGHNLRTSSAMHHDRIGQGFGASRRRAEPPRRVQPARVQHPGRNRGPARTGAVNCTGMGAKQLFGDANMQPIKGQLVLVKPQPALTYLYSDHCRPASNWIASRRACTVQYRPEVPLCGYFNNQNRCRHCTN